MTPGARLQAAIELMVEIDQGAAAADVLIARYFRSRRYAGGGDRRAIIDRVYGIFRRRGALLWRLEEEEGTARSLVLADLALEDRLSFDDVRVLFSGEGYAPETLSENETRLLSALSKAPGPMPDWARGNYPAWLDEELKERFGGDLADEMLALNERAPVDLRVNRARLSREAARERLAAEGIATAPGRYSPHCLRLDDRQDVRRSALFREGGIEIQDESSQLAALLVDAAPGQQIADYCAGAGGKSLALAAEMENRGQIYALDQNASRLGRMAARIRRAGVRNIQSRVLNRQNEAWLAEMSAQMDRVLVDAPCSGCGAWRRNPETRCRLEPERLETLVGVQKELLAKASRLVRPGGRLIYAVCSVLPAEAETVVAAFLAANPAFASMAIGPIWDRARAGTDGPIRPGETNLLLTPARHGTDGFFVAVMAKEE